MADTTVTIAASGADYTTIQSAMAGSDVTSGSYIMQITDTRNYGNFGGLTFTANNGAPSATNRLILTVDANSRHSGIAEYANQTHANWTPGAVNRISISEDYSEISYLEISATFNTVGRILNVKVGSVDFWMHHCILGQGTDTFDFMDIDCPNAPGTISVYLDNNVFVNGDRAIVIDGDTTSKDGEVDLYIDHCAFYGDEAAGGSSIQANISEDNDVRAHVYNSWFRHFNFVFDCVNGTSTSQFIVNGSNNAYGDGDLTANNDVVNNLTNTIGPYDVFETSTSDGILITDEDDPNHFYLNATPIEATGAGVNRILLAATNRLGSEPYTPQDFSLDIVGNVRRSNNVDIGPFQFSAGVGNIQHWNGTDWVLISNIQHWNGTSWVDVANVQHWDGTNWVDV